jgi:GxxExxY protein
MPDHQPRRLNRFAEERDPQTYAIIGAAMEVHGQLGPGFLEAVHAEAMAIELAERHVPYERERAIPVRYKSVLLACGYRADLVCFSDVLVELKAIKTLTNIDYAQLINYLRATGLKRGLLLNFGAPSLQHKRLVV